MGGGNDAIVDSTETHQICCTPLTSTRLLGKSCDTAEQHGEKLSCHTASCINRALAPRISACILSQRSQLASLQKVQHQEEPKKSHEHWTQLVTLAAYGAAATQSICTYIYIYYIILYYIILYYIILYYIILYYIILYYIILYCIILYYIILYYIIL